MTWRNTFQPRAADVHATTESEYPEYKLREGAEITPVLIILQGVGGNQQTVLAQQQGRLGKTSVAEHKKLAVFDWSGGSFINQHIDIAFRISRLSRLRPEQARITVPLEGIVTAMKIPQTNNAGHLTQRV